MSGLRLRETFNRLFTNRFTKNLRKQSVAVALAAAVALPSVAAAQQAPPPINTTRSQTELSQDIESLQDTFNRAVQDRRMILMDRDWIELNEALNNMNADQETRNRLLNQFILQRGGIQMPPDYFNGTTMRDMMEPHTQLLSLTDAQGNELRGCVIFGGVGNLDGATSVTDFIDISRVLHGDDIKDASVKSFPRADEFTKFVTFHEIGHCMDDFFISEMGNATDMADYLAKYHRAETFADVFGVLMIAREEGVTDIAEIIARTRLSDMALSGSVQVEFGDPNSITPYASYIYSTHRAVRAAQDFVDQIGVNQLRQMDYHEIAQRAKMIVDSNALNQKEAEALMYLFQTKHDMNIWDRLRGHVDYVKERYPLAEQLRNEMEQALLETFDMSYLQPGESALDSIEFSNDIQAYIQEMRAANNPAVIQAKTNVLADELVRQADGANATEASLVNAYVAAKDKWRQALDNGTDVQREQAMEKLAVSGLAMQRAVKIVRGVDPDAAIASPSVTPSNDNADPELVLPTIEVTPQLHLRK